MPATTTDAIRNYLAARNEARDAGYDLSLPTQALKHAMHDLCVIIEDADRSARESKLDAIVIADLTASEQAAITDLGAGVVDIAADDARSLRLAGLTEGNGDDIELTTRGERIAARLSA